MEEVNDMFGLVPCWEALRVVGCVLLSWKD